MLPSLSFVRDRAALAFVTIGLVLGFWIPVAAKQPVVGSPALVVGGVIDAVSVRFPVGRGYRQVTLPDGGPRYQTPVQGQGADLFVKGVEAYERRDFEVAASVFQQFTQQHAESPMAGAAHAFRAELLLRQGKGASRYQEAMAVYRMILREFPTKPNGVRARWRLGDLNREQELFVEAQVHYERGLADSPTGEDAIRSLFGLALVTMAREKWKEAADSFALLRRRTEDERLLKFATLGEADALYAQDRWEQAQGLYQATLLRWYAFLKSRPQSLLGYASTLFHLHEHRPAQKMLTLYYNLHPSHPEAPLVLTVLGDSYRMVGEQREAALFFSRVLSQYPDASTAPLARLRLAQLMQASLAEGKKQAPTWLPDPALGRASDPILDAGKVEHTLRDVASSRSTTVLGSEALFHLGEHFEWKKDWTAAIQTYQGVVERAGRLRLDPWPGRAVERLAGLLKPWIVAALDGADDWTATTLFHRLGTATERAYAGTNLMLRIADAHHRLQFTPKAISLYQALVKQAKSEALLGGALIGLGLAYLAQGDPGAARKTFARYRLQFPLGRRTGEVRWLLAKALYQGEDYARLVGTCRKWLKRYPQHPKRAEMLLLLATALQKTGQRAQALRVYRDAGQAGALTDLPSMIGYADLLVKAQQPGSAVLWYRRALGVSATPVESEWARLGLARALLAQKHHREAGQVLNEIEATTSEDVVRRFANAMEDEVSKDQEARGKR